MKSIHHERQKRKPGKNSRSTIDRSSESRTHHNGRSQAERIHHKPLNLANIDETKFPDYVFFRGQLYPTYWVFTYKGVVEPAEGQIVGHTPPLGAAPAQILTWESGGVVARSKDRPLSR